MKKILLLLLFPLTLFGWWDSGHMTVAQIAYDNISPATRAKATAILQCNEYPSSSDFITAACWLDDINEETPLFKKMHGHSSPYDPGNFLSDQQKKEIEARVEATSIVKAIEACCTTLSNPNAGPMMKNIALRSLIHLVGDIHIPVHVNELYSAQFPKGDKGGNLFKINASHCNNLHMYWDSMCGLDTVRLVRPLDESGMKVIENLAYTCTHDVMIPYVYYEKPRDWMMETRQCTPFVYAISPGDTPSEAYEKQGQEICKAQICKAGYRLAYLLEKHLN